MNRQPHAKAVRGVAKAGQSIAVKARGLGAIVIAPNLEGKDEESIVIVKRKARYRKPAFA